MLRLMLTGRRGLFWRLDRPGWMPSCCLGWQLHHCFQPCVWTMFIAVWILMWQQFLNNIINIIIIIIIIITLLSALSSYYYILILFLLIKSNIAKYCIAYIRGGRMETRYKHGSNVRASSFILSQVWCCAYQWLFCNQLNQHKRKARSEPKGERPGQPPRGK